MTGDVMAALDARHEGASRRLHVAVRLDLNRFVTTVIEAQLRARPQVLATLTPARRLALRTRVDDDAIAAADALAQPITDLRVYYGAEVRAPDEEDRGFASTIADAAVAVAGRLLGELPASADPAERAPRFVPSASLVWAWRQVRELDTVRNQLADGAPPSFETHWHLPELADP